MLLRLRLWNRVSSSVVGVPSLAFYSALEDAKSLLTLGHREEHWLEEISENVVPVIPPVLEEEGLSNCPELEENCRASWTL